MNESWVIIKGINPTQGSFSFSPFSDIKIQAEEMLWDTLTQNQHWEEKQIAILGDELPRVTFVRGNSLQRTYHLPSLQ